MTEEQLEERRRKQREYYQENREQILAHKAAKNKEQTAEDLARKNANSRRYWHARKERLGADEVSRLAKEKRLKNSYGLSISALDDLLESQEHSCRICNKHLNQSNLNVDHNHDTGEVRGLLCNNCNRGIGHLQDSIEILESAVEYLKQTGTYGDK